MPYERSPGSADTTARMSNSPHTPGKCPVDIGEAAELYVMKRLSARDALQFAIHGLTCPRYTMAAEDAEAFVAAIKGAARQEMAASGKRPRLCCLPSITSFPQTPGTCPRAHAIRGNRPRRLTQMVTHSESRAAVAGLPAPPRREAGSIPAVRWCALPLRRRAPTPASNPLE